MTHLFLVVLGLCAFFEAFSAPLARAQMPDVNAIIDSSMEQTQRALDQGLAPLQKRDGAAPSAFMNTELREQNFSGQSLAGQSLTNVKVEGGNFDDVDFSGATLMNVDFTNVSLRNAQFNNAKLTNVNFMGGDVRGSNFDSASLMNVSFGEGVKLYGVDFSKAKTMNVDFEGADYNTADVVAAESITAELGRAPKHPGDKASIDLAILFEFDSDKLKVEAWGQLEQLSKALMVSRLASRDFQIEGHTDAKGADEYNMDLSYRRAFAVRKALTEQLGLSADRLSVKGFGESRPVADNESEYGRSQNRRVTIVNMGKN